MFRTPCLAEKIEYVQFNLGTPLTFRGNFQTQSEIGMKFSVKDRDNFYEWYNAYFLVNFKFEASANVGNVAADTQSALINSSFSLINSLTVKSAGKMSTRPLTTTKFPSSKTCFDFSDDYSRFSLLREVILKDGLKKESNDPNRFMNTGISEKN